MKLSTRIALTLTAAVSAGTAEAQVTVPNEFAAGEPARAAEVNQNFSTLAEGINGNAASSAENAAAIADIEDTMMGTGGPAMARSGSIAVVAASGGDYSNPLDAVANVSGGDAWCREPDDDPALFPCVITVAPGNYLLDATLEIPPRISLVGYGPKSSVLRSASGVAVAVTTAGQPGDFGAGADFGIAIRNLAIENTVGDGSMSIALSVPGEMGLEVDNVHLLASGSADNAGIRVSSRDGGGSGPPNRYRQLRAFANGGTTSTGFLAGNWPHPRLDNCEIGAADAATNRGIHIDSGTLTLAGCTVTAHGGQSAVAVSAQGQSTSVGPRVSITASTMVAADASTMVRGFDGVYTFDVRLNDVDVTVRNGSEVTGVWMSLVPPFETGELRSVRITASNGSVTSGLYSESGHYDMYSLRVYDSEIRASTVSGTPAYGVHLGHGSEGTRLVVVDSELYGSTAPVFNAGPNEEWESAFGPPLDLLIRQSTLNGPLAVSGHYARCQFVFDASDFYAFYEDTCPAGSDNRTLPW